MSHSCYSFIRFCLHSCGYGIHTHTTTSFRLSTSENSFTFSLLTRVTGLLKIFLFIFFAFFLNKCVKKWSFLSTLPKKRSIIIRLKWFNIIGMHYAKKPPSSRSTHSVYSHITTRYNLEVFIKFFVNHWFYFRCIKRSSNNLKSQRSASTRSLKSIIPKWYQKPIIKNSDWINVQRGAMWTGISSLVSFSEFVLQLILESWLLQCLLMR